MMTNQLVKRIIHTYEQGGVEAVAAHKWNIGQARWKSHQDLPIFFEQWCRDRDAYDLMTMMKKYVQDTQDVTHKTLSALETTDFETLTALALLRADVVCAEVFYAGLKQQRSELLRWACAHVGDDWDDCFALVATLALSPGEVCRDFHLLLGGWCERTQQCSATPTRMFLSGTDRHVLADIFARVEDRNVYASPMPLSAMATTWIEWLRTQEAWDNSDPYIQLHAKRLLWEAARSEDVANVRLLLGSNTQRIEPHKHDVCVNREDITYVLLQECQRPEVVNSVGPAFWGFVNADSLRNNPYLTTFVQQHDELVQKWLIADLLEATTNTNTSTHKRKM